MRTRKKPKPIRTVGQMLEALLDQAPSQDWHEAYRAVELPSGGKRAIGEWATGVLLIYIAQIALAPKLSASRRLRHVVTMIATIRRLRRRAR